MAKRKRPDTSAKALDVAELRTKIAALRRSGLSLEEIGRKVGLHKTTAWWHLKEMIRAANEAANLDVEAMRSSAVAELEAMMEVWRDRATDDVEATAMFLRLHHERSALLGLHAPKQLQVTANGNFGINTPLPGNREALLAEIQKRLNGGNVIDGKTVPLSDRDGIKSYVKVNHDA